MPVKTTDPRKIVVEWRYRPQLEFFGALDALGIALKEDFPDWQRLHNLLQIESKEFTRRSQFTSSRSFFECDGTEHIDTNVKCIQKVHKEFHARLPIAKYTRLGMRFWFAVVFDTSFEHLVQKLQKRLHSECEKVAALWGSDAKVDDLAYALDLTLAGGWKKHVGVGPMRRDEWFQKLSYEKRIFESESAFDHFRQTVPETFVCLDLDLFQENVSVDAFPAAVESALAMAKEDVRRFIDYFSKG